MKRDEENMNEMTDFFHTVFQKEEVPFDENAWKEAEQLLNREERKYRGFYFQLGADFLALITLIGFLWSANSYSIVYSPRIANRQKAESQPLQLDKKQDHAKADKVKSMETSGEKEESIANTSNSPEKQKQGQRKYEIATSSGPDIPPPSGNNFIPTETEKSENLSATPPIQIEKTDIQPTQLSDKAEAPAQLLKIDVEPMPLAVLESTIPDNHILTRGFAIPKGGPTVFRKGIVAGVSATMLNAKISSKPDIFGGLWSSFLLSPKIEIGSQAIYHLSSVNGIYSISEWTDYGFEKTHTIATVYAENLHFLEFPIHLGYHVGRTQIIVGVKPSYLINTTDYLQLEVNGELRSPQKATYGYMEGLKRLNFAPFLGVQRILHESYLVGARIEYGVTDITKDSFYGTKKDNLLHLKLYLQFIR